MRTCLVRGRESEGRFKLIIKSTKNSRVQSPSKSESELVASERVYDELPRRGDARESAALAGTDEPAERGCRIFAGTCAIIDRRLGIDDTWRVKQPRYKCRTSMFRLVGDPPAGFDGTALIRELLAKVNGNWEEAGRPPARSCKNWRFDKMLDVDPYNRSRETRVEKAIALATDDSWANQIPTASGLIDSQGRRCNVDLARRQGSEYWLFELKCESDHPISAAMQVVRYGVLYIFWREHIDELLRDVERPPLLAAPTVHLRVLAPTNYYAVPNADRPFAWLESQLSAGIQRVAQERGIAMDFQFDVLQETFFTRLYR